MTTPKKFIKDAINGGWRWINLPHYQNVENVINDHDFYIELQLLKPDFWKAVGRTRGWGEVTTQNHDTVNLDPLMWKNQWHHFIDHLADGLSIEEALKAIE